MNYKNDKFTSKTNFQKLFFQFALLLTAAFYFNSLLAAAATPVQAKAAQPVGTKVGRSENFHSSSESFYHSSGRDFSFDADPGQKFPSSPSAGELDALPNLLFDSSSGIANDMVVQPDGKVLVVGYFRTVNAAARKSIVRLNADYTIDTSFSAALNGTITTVALQPDGKILIGGLFDVVNGTNRTRIARLNADGSLDPTFDPGAGADASVYAIAVQPDGKILVGGLFIRVNTGINYYVTRLNANGSSDASFVSALRPPPFAPPGTPPPISSAVYSIALQSDGKIIVGGYIVTSYNGTTAISTPVMRLNQNGSFDTNFNSGASLGSGNASKVLVQPDGKILLVGYFTLINQVRRNFVARLNADGTLDVSFDPGTGANFPVTALYLQTDGRVLIGGRFTTFNGIALPGVARLNTNGSLDETFAPPTGSFGTIQSIVSLPNGKVLSGGVFFGFFNTPGSSIRFYNANGSYDSPNTFYTTALGGVSAIAAQSDGKIIVGGNFTRVGNSGRNGFARINADGSLDENFGVNPNFSSFSTQVKSIILLGDGKILIGGSSIALGNTVGYDIARLNADGTADNSFVGAGLPTSRGINAMALQPDGKIIVVWGYDQPGGTPNGGAARLNADGSLDNTFTFGIPSSTQLNSVAIQPDGKILVGYQGAFGYVNSQTGSVFYNGIARLNSDGTHDRGFIPATSSDFQGGRITDVYSVTLQADGKILIGGSLYKNGSVIPTGIIRLNSTGTLDPTLNAGTLSGVAEHVRVEDVQILPAGKLLVGGAFTAIGGENHTNVARLNPDGSADNSYHSDTDVYGTVNDVATQPDGKYLIGGDFETVSGFPRTSLARLLSGQSFRRPQFDFDGDGKADVSVFRPDSGVWYLQQSTSGFAGMAFGFGTDKLVPADYDGDGKTDVAVYRNGTWYIQRSSLGFYGVAFGAADDIPVPADYDGDGKADIAVFRPSNGTWYLQQSSAGFTGIAFGQNGDKPVAADYDGDGKADVAVNRNGIWYINRSQLGFYGIQFGNSNDKLVPADYDGDGKTDIAVFRPSNGTWYLQQSTAGFTGVAFGLGTDTPVAADYDGDGKADVAVVRQGTWYLQRSTAGFTGIQFGTSTDLPVPNTFVR